MSVERSPDLDGGRGEAERSGNVSSKEPPAIRSSPLGLDCTPPTPEGQRRSLVSNDRRADDADGDVTAGEPDAARLAARSADDVTRRRRGCYERPEGGDAWLVAVVAAVIMFTIATEFGSFGIYYVEYTGYFSVSKASAGWIKGIQTIAGGLFGLVNGTLVKVYGSRKMSFIGSLCSVIGFFAASFSRNVYALYLTQGVLLGIGINMMTVASLVIVQRHFTRNPILGSGVAFMGLTIGSLVSSILISVLIDGYGLRGALLIHSAIVAHGMPASLLLRDPRRASRRSPEVTGRRLPMLEQLKRELCDWSVFRDVKFCLLAASGFLYSYTLSSFINHMPGRAVFYGLSRAQAAYLQPVVSFSGLAARMASTFLANVKCVNKMLAYCLTLWLVAIGTLWYAFVSGFSALVVPAAIFGLGTGSSSTIFIVVFAKLFGIDQLPKSFAFYTFATSAGFSCGPPISGLIFDSTHDYDIPFILAGCVCICANILAAIVMIMHHHDTRANERKLSQSRDPKL